MSGNVTIAGGSASSAGPRLRLYAGGSAGASTGIDLASYQSSSPACFSLTATDLGNGTNTLDLWQYPGSGTTQNNRMRVAGNGNIGLGGQSVPNATLDVTGTGNFSGLLTSGSLNVSGKSKLVGLVTLKAGAKITGAVTVSGQIKGGSLVSTDLLTV